MVIRLRFVKLQGRKNGLQNVINTTQAGLGRLVQLQQENASPNHQAIFLGSVDVVKVTPKLLYD